jgi:hypothetical protein
MSLILGTVRGVGTLAVSTPALALGGEALGACSALDESFVSDYRATHAAFG